MLESEMLSEERSFPVVTFQVGLHSDVLKDRSAVELIVLHRVIREQAPAHAQRCAGGRVGNLGVHDWSRGSCNIVHKETPNIKVT